MYVDSYLTGALGGVVVAGLGEVGGGGGVAVTFASRSLVVWSVNQPRIVRNYKIIHQLIAVILYHKRLNSIMYEPVTYLVLLKKAASGIYNNLYMILF